MASFADDIRHAKRILISQTNGLGDVIHALPAIHAVAATCPQARIDLLVGHHAAGIVEMVPAISAAVIMDGYPRAKSRLRRYLARVKTAWHIARQHYDAIIELSPKDRSVAMFAFSGVRHRLAVNFNARMRRGWLYSHVGMQDWVGEPFHQYVSRALQAKGLDTPYWHLEELPLALTAVTLPPGLQKPYVHLSLFGTESARQFPVEEARALIAGLLAALPQYQLVISCSGAAREVDELATIIGGAPPERVRVFAGNLSVPQLARLIQGATLHVGPDTGSLHLAVLTGCPSVSWFINKSSFLTWAPRGIKHRILLSVAEQNPTGPRICGIRAADVTEAVVEALAARRPPEFDTPSFVPHIRTFVESYYQQQHENSRLADKRSAARAHGSEAPQIPAAVVARAA